MSSKAKLLAVDDSQTVRISLEKAFSKHYIVLLAADAEQCLHLAEREDGIELLLVDYNLPDLNGLEMIEKIRKMPKHKNTPIFIISAEGQTHLKKIAKSLDVVGWVSKPINGQALLDKIKIWKEKKGIA